MCDYSVQNVKSRPASVGDKLTTRNFGTGTRGFAAPEDPTTAVCVLPGTELAFLQGDRLHFPRPAGLGIEEGRAPNGDLPSDQQGYSAPSPRCARVSGRRDRAPD